MDKPKFYCFEIDEVFHSEGRTADVAAGEFKTEFNLCVGSKIAVINTALPMIFDVTNGVKLHVE